MLILSTENENLLSLPQSCGVAHSYARNISIVVNEAPLSCLEIQAKNMVVDLISVLIEASKRIDLVVANISHRGTNEARRPLTDSTDDLWFVTVVAPTPIADWTCGHKVGLVGGGNGGGSSIGGIRKLWSGIHV